MQQDFAGTQVYLHEMWFQDFYHLYFGTIYLYCVCLSTSSPAERPSASMSIKSAENFLKNATQQITQRDINDSMLRAITELTSEVKRLDDEVRRVRREVRRQF